MKYIWLVVGIVIVIVAIIGFRPATLIAPGSEINPISDVTKIKNVTAVVNGTTTSLEIQEVSPDVINKSPSLNRPIVIPKSMSSEAGGIAKKKIETLSAELVKDKMAYDKWLELAIYRKMIEDYDGSREIWEYAILLRPKAFVPYNNLGDLYGYYLKDTRKSEMYFLKAIELDKTQVSLYRNLYSVYRDVMKDNVKARAILEKGISANPATSQDLKQLLLAL